MSVRVIVFSDGVIVFQVQLSLGSLLESMSVSSLLSIYPNATYLFNAPTEGDCSKHLRKLGVSSRDGTKKLSSVPILLVISSSRSVPFGSSRVAL